MSVALEIDGQAANSKIGLGRKWVEPAYFAVTKLPLRSGRYLEESDPPTNVVVSETFAKRFWPRGSPVGHTFRADRSWYEDPQTVVGVVSDFRIDPRKMPDEADSRFYVYAVLPRQGLAGARGWTETTIDTGGSFGFMDVTVRLNSSARLPAVQAVVQRLEPKLQVTAELVDDTYARQNADVLLSTRVVGAFSVIAFIVAIAGLYGVIAFTVASRTREIGIRIALGAERRDISRLVLSSSARLVLTGSAIGCGVAFGVARWIQAQFFGVSPVDPSTYFVVAAVVTGAALAATWQPAAEAARVDPALTLRSE
jgi:predicted lysophospholipase L1 biosynthesis ABC-type transport system permease subunit